MNELLNQEPVTEDLALVSDNGSDTPPVEEPQKEEEPAKEPEKEHQPPPDHPRFNEVYGKMKHFERELQERDGVIEDIRAHNKRLEEVIYRVEGQVSETTRPDPVEDPEGFTKWLTDKAERDWQRKIQEREAQETLDNLESKKPVQSKDVDSIRASQIAVMEDLHDDYETMLVYIDKDLRNDSIVRNRIMNDDNPPKAAYDYAREKYDRSLSQRAKRQDQSFAEDGSPPPEDTGYELTTEERRTAKRLGISEKDYLAQKKYIEGA